MNMRRTVIVSAALAAITAPAAVAVPGDVTRASVTDAGGQSATGGFRGVVSGNGRFVVFVSAQELSGVPTGGKLQAYVRDLRDGRTRLASSSSTGAVANNNVEAGDPFNPFLDITPDGRYVVFRAAATNLVGTDANAQDDVFRKDMTTGEIQLVSVSGAGTQANNFSSDPSISGDGTRVVFVSAATNLVTPDGNNAASDIYMRDFAAGTTTRVSTNSAGEQANDFTERPSISTDGNVVAFEAGPLTTNLYANDTNTVNDIIVKNLTTGATVPAAVTTTATTLGGADVKGGNGPDISGNGRYVIFQTGEVLDATNDSPGTDVYMRDVISGVTTLASARNGVLTGGGGTMGAISADGTRVAFTSPGANLVTGDANATADSFARTIATKETVRMSQLANGTEAALGWETSGISGNGGIGVFTGQGVFSAADSNAADDVYVKELTPTDATSPTLTATAGAGASATTMRVSGTVTDTSGIARVTVAGAPVRAAANGAFTIDIPRPATGTATAAIEAMDGGGNVSSTTVSLATPPRLIKLTVTVTSSRLTARFRLSQPARVVGVLQRRVVAANGTVRFVQVGRTKVVNLKAGSRQVVFARPTRTGTFRLRLTATNSGGKHTVIRAIVLRRVG